MTINQMRTRIIGVYSSDQWKKKVAKMSDAQVITIHSRFMLIGKLS